MNARQLTRTAKTPSAPRNTKEALNKSVVPAKAGIQVLNILDKSGMHWIPAFAGMTLSGLLQTLPKAFSAYRLSQLFLVASILALSWRAWRLGGSKAVLRMKYFVMLFFFAIPLASSAETLGRLFHTPEQRALLDLARKSTPLNAVGEPAAPAASTVQEGLSVSGIVSRSDGKRSTWVNGRLEHDGANIGKQDRTQVWVKLPGGEVKLKVGQSLDPATGQVAEGYRRPPPPEPAAAKPVSPPAPAKAPIPAKRDDNADSDQAATQ